MFLLLFVLYIFFFFLSREGFAFIFTQLTNVHVTDLGAAAPLEQSPAVKVPCWRALWQWSLREDWAFLDLFAFFPTLAREPNHWLSAHELWPLFFHPPSCCDQPHCSIFLLFNSFKSVIFIFAWTLWFWTMKLSTSANRFMSIVLFFLFFQFWISWDNQPVGSSYSRQFCKNPGLDELCVVKFYTNSKLNKSHKFTWFDAMYNTQQFVYPTKT